VLDLVGGVHIEFGGFHTWMIFSTLSARIAAAFQSRLSWSLQVLSDLNIFRFYCTRICQNSEGVNLAVASANCSFAWNFWIKARYCWAHLIRDIRFLKKLPDEKTKVWAEQLENRSRRISGQTPVLA